MQFIMAAAQKVTVYLSVLYTRRKRKFSVLLRFQKALKIWTKVSVVHFSSSITPI